MTNLPPDPWKALGVERNADKTEIRAAYKKLVLKCHPDKVQDPALKAQKQDEFQKVQQAYELLNDDVERAKYEDQLKLAELQRTVKVQQASMKNSPNTSVPRTSSRYPAHDIRTAETSPRSKSYSSPSSGKVYTHYASPHTRSHEEVPSSRVYPVFEESERQARRTASYEKPSKREEERRERDKEERRRRREEDELSRLREREREREREKDREREREKAEREKEREREARKAEKKRLEKEREKERRREADDKARRHKPYVEPYADAYVEDLWIEDEKYVSSRSEKKRSSGKKHDETRERDRDRDREREKSTSRRAKSPHASSVPSSERKHLDHFEHAASYISRAGGSAPSQVPAFWKSQTPPDSFLAPPVAPTPPPVDFEDETIRHAAARAAARRSSNDAARSREKLRYDTVDATTAARPIPTLSKSYSNPPVAPESPPRLSRSSTTPHESYARPIPSLARNQTWAAGGVVDDRRPAAEYYDYESEDDRERRHRRSRRAAQSPPPEPVRYKVEGTKTSKLEPHYSYGESPSSRRYADEVVDSHSPSTTYAAAAPFRYKEAKAYNLEKVKFAEYDQPSYYPTHGSGDGYPVMA
ncbi:hypothetical protein VTK56DRAFT_5228 [Thermocarpiscus australiensis]